jgi:hypothetical protein
VLVVRIRSVAGRQIRLLLLVHELGLHRLAVRLVLVLAEHVRRLRYRSLRERLGLGVVRGEGSLFELLLLVDLLLLFVAQHVLQVVATHTRRTRVVLRLLFPHVVLTVIRRGQLGAVLLLRMERHRRVVAVNIAVHFLAVLRVHLRQKRVRHLFERLVRSSVAEVSRTAEGLLVHALAIWSQNLLHPVVSSVHVLAGLEGHVFVLHLFLQIS